MKIEMHSIPIREVVAGYVDDAENGVRGYGGRLNIRPAFQREFIYNKHQREEVIRTIWKNFPLNVMYWVKNLDGTFELLDGQQRTISICQYHAGDFSLEDHRTFDSLKEVEQEQFLNYELMIYICEGDDREKLDWFQTINIASLELTRQELRNAIFACAWLTAAKQYFSKPNCPAKTLYERYLVGSALRQDYLETALKWISARKNLSDIRDYMNQQKSSGATDCRELWDYFEDVFSWVGRNFEYRREMKGLDWGLFYNRYGDKIYDAAEFERRTVALLDDEDVTNNRGIYEYLLDGDERHLSIRKFSDKIKRKIYEQQGGECAKCGRHFPIEKMHADHITPWSRGGHTTIDNCQILCENCNRIKSDV